ncbi:MAG: polymer-forming cytoskeletal protein [Lachnospiraceae bacterium]|nr:polymer-forming cytoskeletal protein [Lachnospiraceae bacterium]
MNIAGAGSLPGGVYDDLISISGSGKITGSASCKAFHCSGAGSVEGDLMCQEEFRCSGSGKVRGSIQAMTMNVSGAFACEGTVTVSEELRVSGAFRAGRTSAGEFRGSGATTVNGDLSAETIRISGAVHCKGLLNGDTIDIRYGGDSEADNVGGSNIRIVPGESRVNGISGFFRRMFGGEDRAFTFDVPGSIEGDEVYLEHVSAASVTGRIVTIGPGCDIGKLFYIENATVSPDAAVGSTEQLPG